MLLQIFNFFFKLVDQTYSFFLCFQNPFSYLHGADLLQPLCSDGLRVFSSPFGWAGWWGSEFSGGVRKKKTGRRKSLPKTAVAPRRIATLLASLSARLSSPVAWGFC